MVLFIALVGRVLTVNAVSDDLFFVFFTQRLSYIHLFSSSSPAFVSTGVIFSRIFLALCEPSR